MDLVVKNGIVIPDAELEITASRAGGPGGQHVNKTSTKIMVRWNVRTTTALTDEQKERVCTALASQLTTEGDLIIHSSSSRSQEQNKKEALALLVAKIKKALVVPKKRIPTKVPKQVKESRLEEKKRQAQRKKLRGKRIAYGN